MHRKVYLCLQKRKNMKTYITIIALCLATAIHAQQKKDGRYYYEGEKINLASHSFKCYHVAKLSGVSKQSYQGFDIWGDYAFSCQNTGYLTIYKFKDGGLEKQGETFKLASWNEKNHANVVSFGTKFYEPKDQFPLLYVSQCQKETINGLKDILYVERIGKDLKSTTVVQTICFKDTKNLFGYALQWVIDRENQFLYGYGNTINNSDPANKHRIVKFRLPTIDAPSKDGVTYLTNDDLLENYLLEETYSQPFNPIGQGLFIKNDMLFMPTGVGNENNPSILYVWDLKNRRMRNAIDLTKATFGELEDCSVYQDDLYIQTQGHMFRLKF